ncbi:MAG: hypothetical protein NUV47_00440 [Patescibacteria group bacterium]|nr:hypothetical protein [Patescibacteria group bacterium]
MLNVLNLHKEIGETPLECINRFKKENPEYENVKMSYAGRLDPVAEGVLLVLVGEENKNRKIYLNYKKEYVFEILFGIRTDTYDILGKIIDDKDVQYDFEQIKPNIKKLLLELKGIILQKYPPYSSKTVNGKSLFQWSREGKINEIKIPEREVEIYKISLISFSKVTKEKLKNLILQKISLVKGDFRQKEIIKLWNKFFENTKREYFDVAEVKVFCSSGTYVRSIANSLGEKIKVPSLALKIVRTKLE